MSSGSDFVFVGIAVHFGLGFKSLAMTGAVGVLFILIGLGSGDVTLNVSTPTMREQMSSKSV